MFRRNRNVSTSNVPNIRCFLLSTLSFQIFPVPVFLLTPTQSLVLWFVEAVTQYIEHSNVWKWLAMKTLVPHWKGSLHEGSEQSMWPPLMWFPLGMVYSSSSSQDHHEVSTQDGEWTPFGCFSQTNYSISQQFVSLWWQNGISSLSLHFQQCLQVQHWVDDLLCEGLSEWQSASWLQFHCKQWMWMEKQPGAHGVSGPEAFKIALKVFLW